MKAVGYFKSLPISDPDSLLDLDLPEPQPRDHDLVVSVKAISVNPADVKLRATRGASHGQPQVLGWDAAGVVESVGAKVSLFKPGDHAWYAGDLTRQGSNAERQAVDERIVGRMPSSIGFSEAAAMPLTTITAWEILFDRLRVQDADPATDNRILIIGAAGGVGSMLLQLARKLTGLTVIGTASRTETRQWVMDMGAHHTIDHSQPWRPQLKALGIDDVTHVVGLHHTDTYAAQIIDVLRPEGKLALIDDPATLDVVPFKLKSLSIHWELMFTRSMFDTSTQIRQHMLLNRVADLVDDGILRSTVNQVMGRISAQTLQLAHAHIETGQAHGKIVLDGYDTHPAESST